LMWGITICFLDKRIKQVKKLRKKIEEYEEFTW